MAGNSCPLCGSPVEGREAVEVRQEHRELVVAAKAGQALADRVQSVTGRLKVRIANRYGEDDSDELRELREGLRYVRQELTAALKEYRDAAGWSD
jgi:ribosome-binding protein aMBF1 (putative translation factor)